MFAKKRDGFLQVITLKGAGISPVLQPPGKCRIALPIFYNAFM